MKKIIATILTLTLLISCTAKDDLDGLIEDGKQSYQNLTEEVDRLKVKVGELKDSATATVEEIKDAVEALEKAKDALTSIGDDEKEAEPEEEAEQPAEIDDPEDLPAEDA